MQCPVSHVGSGSAVLAVARPVVLVHLALLDQTLGFVAVMFQQALRPAVFTIACLVFTISVGRALQVSPVMHGIPLSVVNFLLINCSF